MPILGAVGAVGNTKLCPGSVSDKPLVKLLNDNEELTTGFVYVGALPVYILAVDKAEKAKTGLLASSDESTLVNVIDVKDGATGSVELILRSEIVGAAPNTIVGLVYAGALPV